MPKNQKVPKIVRIPLKEPQKDIPECFNSMPILYLELLENKDKIRPELRDTDYSPEMQNQLLELTKNREIEEGEKNKNVEKEDNKNYKEHKNDEDNKDNIKKSEKNISDNNKENDEDIKKYNKFDVFKKEIQDNFESKKFIDEDNDIFRNNKRDSDFEYGNPKELSKHSLKSTGAHKDTSTLLLSRHKHHSKKSSKESLKTYSKEHSKDKFEEHSRHKYSKEKLKDSLREHSKERSRHKHSRHKHSKERSRHKHSKDKYSKHKHFNYSKESRRNDNDNQDDEIFRLLRKDNNTNENKEKENLNTDTINLQIEDNKENVRINNDPPKLSDIDKENPVYQQIGQHKIRDISRLTRQEEEESKIKRELLFKFDILRRQYPGATIPEYSEYTDRMTLQKMYDDVLRRLTLDSEVEEYKKYLTWSFIAVEFVLGKVFKIDMTGFTKQQLMGMNKYERLLIELGERSYLSGMSRFPVELRLIALVVINTGFFIITKTFTNSFGDVFINLFNQQMNKSNVNTTPQPQTEQNPSNNFTFFSQPDISKPVEPQKKKMKPPSI